MENRVFYNYLFKVSKNKIKNNNRTNKEEVKEI